MVLTAAPTGPPIATLYYPTDPTKPPGFTFSPVFSVYDPFGDAPVTTQLVGAVVGATADNGSFTGQVTSIEFYTRIVTTALTIVPVETTTELMPSVTRTRWGHTYLPETQVEYSGFYVHPPTPVVHTHSDGAFITSYTVAYWDCDNGINRCSPRNSSDGFLSYGSEVNMNYPKTNALATFYAGTTDYSSDFHVESSHAGFPKRLIAAIVVPIVGLIAATLFVWLVVWPRSKRRRQMQKHLEDEV
ncbi:hypothetical protein DL96DRAFT_1821874 [Flagelloscypha sp. PMI_526]|nr:hypothetical protein DL96DRAFT_1821874 [Flagelloscypha sp. PMI_526]